MVVVVLAFFALFGNLPFTPAPRIFGLWLEAHHLSKTSLPTRESINTGLHAARKSLRVALVLGRWNELMRYTWRDAQSHLVVV